MKKNRRLIKTIGDLKAALDELGYPDHTPIRAWVDDIEWLQDINFAYRAFEDYDTGEYTFDDDDLEDEVSGWTEVALLSVGN